MARSAFAEERLEPGTLALSLLFFWLKAWQSVFAVHLFFFLQAEDGIRYATVTGVQTCALPIFGWRAEPVGGHPEALEHLGREARRHRLQQAIGCGGGLLAAPLEAVGRRRAEQV